MHRLTWPWVLTGLLLVTPPALAQAQSPTFSLTQISHQFPSQGYEPRVAFWRAVFTQYGANQVILHDTDDLRLIYEVVEFKEGAGRSRAASRRHRRTVRARIHRLSVAMNRLRTHGPNPKNPDAVQQRILKLVRSAGLQPSRTLFRKLRHNIHAQRGVKERFRKGVIRSGRYLQTMEAIFERHGLPKVLVRLPHVESSFNYASRSSKGAAGIWQFMPRTGRAYKLRVGRTVDERLDPIAATDGAARYLKDAYRKLGNWPLAITSYNHGQAGIARAKRRHGPNLLTIIDKYRSRSFRYASKNFYAEFLAAVEVSENYRTYFGPLELLEPHRYQEIYLEKSVRVRTFTAIEGLSQDVLREYNPQFKRRLWTRSRVLPAGFKLRLPGRQSSGGSGGPGQGPGRSLARRPRQGAPGRLSGPIRGFVDGHCATVRDVRESHSTVERPGGDPDLCRPGSEDPRFAPSLGRSGRLLPVTVGGTGRAQFGGIRAGALSGPPRRLPERDCPKIRHLGRSHQTNERPQGVAHSPGPGAEAVRYSSGSEAARQS